MPVRRYRTVDDMPAPPRATSPAEGLARACELFEITAVLGRSHPAPRGVRRFRSVEEADAERRQREIHAMRELQREHTPDGQPPIGIADPDARDRDRT